MIIRLRHLLLSFAMLTLFYCQSIEASSSMRGVLTHTGQNELKLVPGDFFSGVIRIWPHPYNLLNLEKYRQLEGKPFLVFFFITSIDAIKFSKNNRDVLEIYATFVLRKPFVKQEFYILPLADFNIPITLKDLTILPRHKAPPQSMIVLDQLVSSYPWYKFFAVLAIILGVVFVVFLIIVKAKNIRKKRLKIQAELDEMFFWKNNFIKASERADFEGIYQHSKEWRKILKKGIDSNEVDTFLRSVSQYQYKESWTFGELEEININFEKIRHFFD